MGVATHALSMSADLSGTSHLRLRRDDRDLASEGGASGDNGRVSI